MLHHHAVVLLAHLGFIQVLGSTLLEELLLLKQEVVHRGRVGDVLWHVLNLLWVEVAQAHVDHVAGVDTAHINVAVVHHVSVRTVVGSGHVHWSSNMIVTMAHLIHTNLIGLHHVVATEDVLGVVEPLLSASLVLMGMHVHGRVVSVIDTHGAHAYTVGSHHSMSTIGVLVARRVI